MAKVLISLPDDVLEELDARAGELGATRSGFLRELIERELDSAQGVRTARVRALLARPGREGGDATTAVRAARRSR
ncbi:MAG: CopG family ribbon-helix-helix protein [Solirubrobacterales bacterium]